MSEAATLQEIRLALGREPGLRLFRHNQGALRDITGRVVTFGLHPGCPDLIGWRAVTVTPEMVGRVVGLFAGVEIKAPGGKHPVTPEQQRFIAAIAEAGGLAGVARNVAQARHILGLPPT